MYQLLCKVTKTDPNFFLVSDMTPEGFCAWTIWLKILFTISVDRGICMYKFYMYIFIHIGDDFNPRTTRYFL